MVSITGKNFFERDYTKKAKYLKKMGQAKNLKIILRTSVILFFICMCVNGILIYNFLKILSNL